MNRRTLLGWASLVAAVSLAVFGLTLQPALADQLSFTASADTWVDQNAPTSTAGGAATTLQIAQATKLKRAFLTFNVTGIPADATGVTATVDLTTRTSMTKTIELHALNSGQTFAEATTNWNNQPTFAAAVLSTKCCLATGSRFTMAAGNVNGNGTWSFAIINKTTQNGSESLQSREGTPDVDDPKLTVTYSPAATTTTVPATTTTTEPPPPGCLLTSSYASPQAAVDATPAGGCLTVTSLYTLTDPLTMRSGITVQCLTAANGFTGTSPWTLLVVAGLSDFSFQGCTLSSSGPTLAAAGGIDLSGTLTRVRFADLTIRDVEYGIAGSPTVNGTGWTDTTFGLRVLNVDITRTYATGVGLYANGSPATNQTRYVELGDVDVTDYQRAGSAGKAGIQSGGIGNTETTLLHSQWTIHNSDLVATCPGGDLVGIGLDQADHFTVDDNTVSHGACGSEGIVVNGPNNTVRRNHVNGVQAGAFTFISYGTPAQAVTNLVMEDNVASDTHEGQGIALSFGPNGLPMTGLRIRRFTGTLHDYGIQSYPYQGTQAGSDNRIEDSTVSGNDIAGCQGLDPLNVTIVNTPGCSAAPPVCSPGTPLTITAGGTYTGCYRSTSSATPAVTVNTTEAVTLDHARVEHAGLGVRYNTTGIQFTALDSVFQALPPSTPGASQIAFGAYQPARVVLEHNRFSDGHGISFNGERTAIPTSIRFNDFVNIGRYPPTDLVQAVGLDKVNPTPVAPETKPQIAWNRVTQTFGQSHVEDVFNFYKSNGTQAAPIDIHHNLINGAFYQTSATFNGGGILLGDTSPGELGGQWGDAHDNTVVSTSNYGGQITGGSHNRLRDNSFINDGLAGGQPYGPDYAVGISVWDGWGTGGMVDNAATGNTVGWRQPDGDRNDLFCDPPADPTCTPNTLLANPIDAAAEQAAVSAWESSAVAAGHVIGPR